MYVERPALIVPAKVRPTVTVAWSLTVTGCDRTATAATGCAEDRDGAVTALLAATHDAIAAAAMSAAGAARYELRAAGELVALIRTGVDEDGSPDYASTSALIQRIAAT